MKVGKCEMAQTINAEAKIKNVPINKADRFILDNKLWGFEDYHAEVCAQIAYDESGFLVQFTIGESNPLVEKTRHFEEVCQDSCVEFFVNFTPEHSDRYINFEVNAAGIMYVGIGTDRYDNELLTMDEVKGLNAVTEVSADHWTVSYGISFELIRKYYPQFDMAACEYLQGNLHKCGSRTAYRHYLTYYPIGCERPDFHRPEYFGRFAVEKPE